jgi:S1-C subfamily serine protease
MSLARSILQQSFSGRHHFLRLRLVSAVAATVAALVLSLCAGPSLAGASALRPSAKPVVTPSEIPSIVAADTAINNRANSSLSLPLQDSHESCLQQILDDATYRGDLAAGSNTLGGSFDQVPGRVFVPHETTYPAFFSVLAEDRASSESVTNNLLTYVKTSPEAHWKLDSSSEILGPTDAGVTVPAAATDAQGYASSLGDATIDGLVTAPDRVAALVAKAFTSEAATGKLPAGLSAQFGPKNVANPHSIAASYAKLGRVTMQFSTVTPAAATAGAPSPECPYPAYRLADGGALVTFPVFATIVVKIQAGYVVTQPLNRSALGVLLPPGTYNSITMVSGDMDVAVVPPTRSRQPIEVIGQASEGLTETGALVSAPASSSAPGGPKNAAAIASEVGPGLVDIDTTLSYEGEEAEGTGMVLTSKGEILTNNHVIEDASSIRVVDVGNGKTYGANVVGYDRTADVAVLQLEHASDLQTVRLGNSSSVRKGQGVVGVGNAGGAGGTPSFVGGSVTALDQSISASDAGNGTSEELTGLIETNADIQPGDSGGPLVNSSGKVIGMDTAASAGFSFEQGGFSTTQGFSIPIDTALKIAGEITADDSSSTVHVGPTAFLGVNVTSPSVGFGAEIVSVVSGSPASQAGLAEGDTITSLGGHSVSSPNSLTTIIEGAKPGVSVPLVYVDPSGAKQTVTVHLASGPPQ